jgi:hypothetical protein
MVRENFTMPILNEEIERVQELLHQLDEILNAKEEPLALKDLALAVDIAGSGGRAIATLRKAEQELEEKGQDQEYEKLRSGLFALLERLGERREASPSP